MIDRAYIQFIEEFKDTLFLCNGFSRVWDECLATGSMWWARRGDDLPAQKEEVYVTCYYTPQLFQVFKWAENYPSVKFIVGGPAANVNYISIPKNVEFKLGFVEREVFNKPATTTWKLELPEAKEKRIVASYTIDQGCYWGKCIFCSGQWQHEGGLHYRASDLVLPSTSQSLVICLATSSIRPEFIKEELHKLPTSVRYFSYLRPDASIIRSLSESLPKCERPELFSFSIGVEFPSNKMQRFMKKFLTTDLILKTTKLLTDFGCRVRYSMIVGWSVLTKDDLVEAQKFVEEALLINKDIYLNVYGLTAKLDSGEERRNKLIVMNKGTWVKYESPYYASYYQPVLSEEQRQLNVETLKLYAENFRFVEYFQRNVTSINRLLKEHVPLKYVEEECPI